MPDIYSIHPLHPDTLILKKIVRCIYDGGIIIYPTETFYGIGVLFSDQSALKRLFQIKQRDELKPILLLIPDTSFLDRISINLTPVAFILGRQFWPGPLTLLMNASSHLSPLLTGVDKKVGIRISSSPFVMRLMSFLKNPITSTSANLSGGKSPCRIDEIPEDLRNAVDIIIDSGETPGGSPSTVFDISQKSFAVVREGAVPSSLIMQVLQNRA